jgi:hypothetical protein
MTGSLSSLGYFDFDFDFDFNELTSLIFLSRSEPIKARLDSSRGVSAMVNDDDDDVVVVIDVDDSLRRGN